MNYDTLDSGARAEYESGMVRDTEEGKARFDLLYPLAMPHEAQLLVRSRHIVQECVVTIDDSTDLDDEKAEYSSRVLASLERWLLEDRSRDHAAIALADLSWIAEIEWTIENDGSMEYAPYEDVLMTRFAALMARGAVKYDARNWEKGDGLAELLRAYSSGHRHFRKWRYLLKDEDHLAGTAFNLLAGDYYQWKLKRGFWKQEAQEWYIYDGKRTDSPMVERGRE